MRPSLRRLPALDHDGLHLARPASAKRRRVIVFLRLETGVTLLSDKDGLRSGGSGVGSQEIINQSVEGIEYELATAIHGLTNEQRKKIGLVRGHGELDSLALWGFTHALLERYDVLPVTLSSIRKQPSFDALIIAKPTKSFSEVDKYNLDRYILSGGKVVFLLDQYDASMDSASREDYYAFPFDLRLSDQLFRYGVRINEDLVQDLVSAKYPVVIGENGNKPELMQMEWPFFPLITHYAKHPVTRNLDAAWTRFVSSIDTVKAVGIKKTPLFFSSPDSRRVGTPVKIGINDLRRGLKPENYQEGEIPLAYLLEGKFTSLYKNRFAPPGADTTGRGLPAKPSKVVVIADGDIARNDINPRNGQPQPLGMDPFTGYTFANETLLLNLVTYLIEENGVINARNKEVKVRPLDKKKIKAEQHYWQAINLGTPLLALFIFGFTRSYFRKRKYAQFTS